MNSAYRSRISATAADLPRRSPPRSTRFDRLGVCRRTAPARNGCPPPRHRRRERLHARTRNRLLLRGDRRDRSRTSGDQAAPRRQDPTHRFPCPRRGRRAGLATPTIPGRGRELPIRGRAHPHARKGAVPTPPNPPNRGPADLRGRAGPNDGSACASPIRAAMSAATPEPSDSSMRARNPSGWNRYSCVHSSSGIRAKSPGQENASNDVKAGLLRTGVMLMASPDSRGFLHQDCFPAQCRRNSRYVTQIVPSVPCRARHKARPAIPAGPRLRASP